MHPAPMAAKTWTFPAAFASHPALKGQPAACAARLARTCVLKEFAPGANIFVQGHDRMWFVLEGLVRISVPSLGAAPVTAELLGPGTTFGDSCCRGAGEPVVEATALMDSVLLGVPYKNWDLHLRNFPAATRQTCELLYTRMRDSYRLRGMLGEDSRRRVLSVLVWLTATYGRKVSITRRRLAEASEVATETAIRALAPLERSGILNSRRGVLEVLDIKRLRRAASA